MDFEKVAFYFFTSNPAFSQAYALRVRASFSPAETSFTALSFVFSQQFSFPLRAFSEGYNHELTSLFHIHNLANHWLIFSATNYA
jgi:hypothetical protein